MNVEMYLKAKKLMRERKFDEALEILEYLDDKYPGDDYIEFSIAKIKVRNYKTKDEAKKIFEKLLKGHNEHSSSALLELGKIDVHDKEYSKARSKFKKLIKRENDTLAYIELAKLESNLRNYKEAKKLLQYVVEVNDQYYASALLALSKVERESGDMVNAKIYAQKIPQDSPHVKKEWVILELSKIEISLGNIEAGINLLNSIIETPIKGEVLAEFVKLYIRLEQYELAYKYNISASTIDNCKININVKQIDTFLKYKLGIDISEDKRTYFTYQLTSYDREEALRHIKTHLDENDEKMVHSIFSQTVDIDQLYEFVQEQIKEMTPSNNSLNDRYIIRCNKIIGTSIENEATDTILVIVVPNTKNILTMYPIPAEDNELKIEPENIKQKKRESQIEKFNRRYLKK